MSEYKPIRFDLDKGEVESVTVLTDKGEKYKLSNQYFIFGELDNIGDTLSPDQIKEYEKENKSTPYIFIPKMTKEQLEIMLFRFAYTMGDEFVDSMATAIGMYEEGKRINFKLPDTEVEDAKQP